MGIKENQEVIREFFHFVKNDMRNLKEILKAYEDGQRNGYWWPDEWQTHGHPDGPYVSKCLQANRPTHDERNCEICEAAALSAMKNLAWRTGWSIGKHRQT